jgi:ferric-dicitrate binding protein FerR (iron transport regulator)
MNLSDEEILELHELLNGLVEKNLPPAKLTKLESWLLESPDARREYVSFMDMSSSLAHYAEEIVTDEDESDQHDTSPVNNIIHFVRPALAIAALFVIGFTLFNFWTSNPDSTKPRQAEVPTLEQTPPATLPEESVFAVLTHTVGVQWGEGTEDPPALGQTLDSCKLEVESGLVQLEFIRGSTVILEGPVSFEIKGSNEGSLQRGKLRANVPPVAKGFSVDLPHGRLVDLGTEFGLHVHDGGSTEIFVYKGRVRYDGLSNTDEAFSHEISSGEALFVDPYGHPSWIEMPSEPFMGTADLAFISMEQSQNRYSSWVSLSEEIAQSNDTLLYYSFDNHAPWSRTLNDLSNQANGAVVGCKWTDGRWPGKGALGFSRKNDQVRLDFPAHHPALTLGAWLSLNSLGQYPSPIISSDSNSNGAVSWYVNPKGKLVLELNINGKPKKYESAVAFRKERLGRWMHVATTYDPVSKMVTHYVNGRSFSREKIVTSAPLHFGSSLLGNFSKNSLVKYKRSMQGKIDEFVLFKEAFDEVAVRRLFEIGCPYEIPNAFGNFTP